MQYRNSVLSHWFAYEWIKRFKNGHTSINHAGCPSTSITDANNVESMTWSCRTDDWLLIKWHINRKFFMGQPMKLSTTSLPSIKSVLDGSQSNSQNCTKRSVWTSANSFWITMVLKVTTSWNESSREMKHGSTVLSQRVRQSMEWKHPHSPTK